MTAELCIEDKEVVIMMMMMMMMMMMIGDNITTINIVCSIKR